MTTIEQDIQALTERLMGPNHTQEMALIALILKATAGLALSNPAALRLLSDHAAQLCVSELGCMMN